MFIESLSNTKISNKHEKMTSIKNSNHNHNALERDTVSISNNIIQRSNNEFNTIPVSNNLTGVPLTTFNLHNYNHLMNMNTIPVSNYNYGSHRMNINGLFQHTTPVLPTLLQMSSNNFTPYNPYNFVLFM